jgi:hypothetical protein
MDPAYSTASEILTDRMSVTCLDSIVGVALGRVRHVAEAGSHRGRIASEFARNNAPWLSSCPRRSLRKNRSAPRRSRRGCTRMCTTSP